MYTILDIYMGATILSYYPDVSKVTPQMVDIVFERSNLESFTELLLSWNIYIIHKNKYALWVVWFCFSFTNLTYFFFLFSIINTLNQFSHIWLIIMEYIFVYLLFIHNQFYTPHASWWPGWRVTLFRKSQTFYYFEDKYQFLSFVKLFFIFLWIV